MVEQLSRNHAFLGTEGQKAVNSSFVVIIGLGVLGSQAATILARTGIGRIRLVDPAFTVKSMSCSSTNYGYE